MGRLCTSFIISGATEIHIQDKYALDEVKDKWPEVQSFLREAPKGKRDALYFNFTSGYFKKSFLNIPDIPRVAMAINPFVSDWFDKAPRGRYGVVVMDFVDLLKSQRIIATNEDQ